MLSTVKKYILKLCGWPTGLLFETGPNQGVKKPTALRYGSSHLSTVS